MVQNPPIQIVDTDDRPVGQATIDEAYEQGLLHRVVYVILQNSIGEILLQKRGPEVLNYPNRWDISSAGHVDAGEDYIEAANRELKEELGLEDLDLKEAAYFKSDETHYGVLLHRFNKIYTANLSTGQKLTLQPGEVADTRWFALGDIKRMVAYNPDDVASGLVLCMERVFV